MGKGDLFRPISIHHRPFLETSRESRLLSGEKLEAETRGCEAAGQEELPTFVLSHEYSAIRSSKSFVFLNKEFPEPPSHCVISSIVSPIFPRHSRSMEGCLPRTPRRERARGKASPHKHTPILPTSAKRLSFSALLSVCCGEELSAPYLYTYRPINVHLSPHKHTPKRSLSPHKRTPVAP